MAIKKSSSYFAIRLLGLTAIFATLVSAALWIAGLTVGMWLFIASVLVVLGALAVEAQGVIEVLTSRRGALGSSVIGQVILASLIFVGLNAFSFRHHLRWDWTRGAIFTLPVELRQQLEKLRGETDIIVYQKGGQAGADHYDAAAERKIVEKVQDLAEQFQELGPRFHVELLDRRDMNFQGKLDKIGEKSAALAEAIKTAPENSIFFYARDHFQRLAFHDIYQLDREASKNTSNLVLNYQGPGPFARRILNIEERKPKVALGVIHELLSFTDPTEDHFTMNAAGKALKSHGFETVDIVLKTGWDVGAPKPSAVTFDESRFEALEAEKLELEASIKVRKGEIETLNKTKKFWKDSSLAKINEEYTVVVINNIARLLPKEVLKELDATKTPYRTFDLNDRVRDDVLADVETDLAAEEFKMGREKGRLAEVVAEQAGLNVDNLVEQKRIDDVGAKLKRLLTDCDLLILPRQTALDVTREYAIPNRVHELAESQFEAVKEFIKQGKPVLFCLGPSNTPARGFDPRDQLPDELERMLKELGVELPKQMVLFETERKAFAEKRGRLLIMGAPVEPPPVIFNWKAGAGLPGTVVASKTEELKPHPIRESLLIASKSVGEGVGVELRLRHPRPVYLNEKKVADHDIDPTLFMSARDSWNENNPFPTPDRTPQFERPKKTDPSMGTVREPRRGPFPLAVAFEEKLPGHWFLGSDVKQPTDVRMVVVGHGGVFAGKSLSVMQEKLLLDSCNWLLGRDDLLAREYETWHYPRVQLSETGKILWGCLVLVLVLAFFYLAGIVGIVRSRR